MKWFNKKSPLETMFSIDSIYDVADVPTSYRYWFTKLLQFCLSIFEWDNIPEKARFTGRDIELQLLLTGHAVIFMRHKNIYTVRTSVFDYDVNYQPIRYTFGNPVIGTEANEIINSLTSGIIYNSPLMDTVEGVPLDGSLLSFIQHYARMLADIDSTAMIYARNMRITDYPIAKNDQMKKSLEYFFKQRKIGRDAIVWQNDEILDAFGSVPKQRVTADTLKDILECEDRVLEKFYRDLGIKFRQPKQAQLNTEEVEADEQILLISCDDMLKYRKEGIEEINNKLGTDIRVKLNPLYDRNAIKEKRIEDENKQNSDRLDM